MPLKVLVSAIEPSSVQVAAKVLKQLKLECASRGETLDVCGLVGESAGAEWREMGFRSLVSTKGMSVMGVQAVLKVLRLLFQRLKEARTHIAAEKPDLVLVFDYPDFHFRLIKHLKYPVVWMIPPKVWIWRAWRFKKLKASCQFVLCVLPFEEAFFRERGVMAHFVGHPLIEVLECLPERALIREQEGFLSPQTKIAAFLPGSRWHEIKRHFVFGLSAWAEVLQHLSSTSSLRVFYVVPAYLQERVEMFVKSLSLPQGLSLEPFAKDAKLLLKAADVALVKSGTATLEAGWLECPFVCFYRPSWTEYILFRLLSRWKGPVSLYHLLLGTKASEGGAVREYVYPHLDPKEVGMALGASLSDLPTRRSVLEEMGRLKKVFGPVQKGRTFSRAARLLADFLTKKATA